jgi:hypothetical protein
LQGKIVSRQLHRAFGDFDCFLVALSTTQAFRLSAQFDHVVPSIDIEQAEQIGDG